MLRKILDIYFYGNIHIALAALFFTFETYILIDVPFFNLYYLSFVFGSTLAMYNLHRLIGLHRIVSSEMNHRYQQIEQSRTYLYVLLIIGALISIFSFLQLDLATIYKLGVAIGLSVLYVIPIFPASNRLRDFNYVKIFLIAMIWAWIAMAIPHAIDTKLFYLLLIEKFCFILAITIPFDIRDVQIDQNTEVKTLISALGIKKGKILSYLLIIVAIGINIALMLFYPIMTPLLIIIIVIEIISIFFIRGASPKSPDLLFTGWLDGLILLRGMLLMLFMQIMS